MKAMLEVDEHHWWYRGRRRIIAAELARLPLPPARRRCSTPAAARAARWWSSSSSARCTGSSSIPRRPRWPAAGRHGEVVIGRLEELPWEDAHVRPDHLPRRDRAHARRSGDAERAAARVQARRLAAGHRARLPGAVVHCTTRPTTTYRRYIAPDAARGGARGRLAGRSHDLVQQPAAGRRRPPSGSPSAAAAPRNGSPTRRTSSSGRTGSTGCSSSRCGSRRAG